MTEGGDSVFKYRMTNNVAPYLIAIAVGDLEFQSLGARSGVWTEPAMLRRRRRRAGRHREDDRRRRAALRALSAGSRYDMLVLPPSFPFGGMENPNLTFLTPTFIAGDKSLVSLIAHELAHSWSGNLVDQRHLGRFLAQRGHHHLCDEPHRRGDLRAQGGGAADCARRRFD